MDLFYDLFVHPVEGADPKKGGSLTLGPAQPEAHDAGAAANSGTPPTGRERRLPRRQPRGRGSRPLEVPALRQELPALRAGVDDNVGRVLDYLDENGLAENTIVIYSSDQGFYLGDHGWYDKRWMYEESLKMPFLVRWPGVIHPAPIRPR